MATVQWNDDVIDVLCDSADELFAILDPVSGTFRQTASLDGFLFRGVADANVQLLPSAFRATVQLRGIFARSGPHETSAEQCQAELATLREFFNIAARQGLRLPEDSQVLRRQFDDWALELHKPSFTWPPTEILSLIAIAQHHGIPTRALDWTLDPYIATYFAACESVRSPKGEFAVWVVNYLAHQMEGALALTDRRYRPLIVFTAPGADNPNLRAQRGFFMLWRQQVGGSDELFTPTAYNQLLQANYFHMKQLSLVTRVRLPADHARVVLSQLAAIGVTAARLFPGFWGVAREFKEESLLLPGLNHISRSAVAAVVHDQIWEKFRERAPNSLQEPT